MTQKELIVEHLHEYGSITPLDALREYGIMRLASRMADLKADGFLCGADDDLVDGCGDRKCSSGDHDAHLEHVRTFLKL